MKLPILLLAIGASAFQPRPLSIPLHHHVHSHFRTALRATKQSDGTTMDINRVRECADSFGKCSVDELKELKEDIINNRVQQFVMKGEMGSKDLRHFEEEIDIQIGFLETQNEAAKSPATTTKKKSKNHVKFDGHLLDVPSAADMLMFEETLIEENLLEPLAMCFVVALLVFLPQLMS